MGRYLISDRPEVDRIINIIITEIACRFNPRSIILPGGFGRGEASVYEANGRLKFLSDCEITMVSGKSTSKEALKRLSLELYHKTGIEIILHDSIMLRIYTQCPWLSRLAGKFWRPSIQHYDLKYGSQTVFGDDILNKIPDIGPQDIPLWEGIRLMLNRMAAALEYFPFNRKDRDESIYWINKVILACQDALLLSLKQYHYSYKSRNLMFQDLFPGHFDELSQQIPGFLSLASRATDYKLRPTKDAYPEDLSGLWFDAVDICDHVFRYIIKKDMDIVFDNYAEFPWRYRGHPKTRQEYYSGLISFPVFRNIATAVRMARGNSCKFPAAGLIANFRIPWQHIIYSVIPLVYFGLSRDGKINELQLNQARHAVSLFKKLEPRRRDLLEEWKYIKEQACELWHTFC